MYNIIYIYIYVIYIYIYIYICKINILSYLISLRHFAYVYFILYFILTSLYHGFAYAKYARNRNKICYNVSEKYV